MTQFAALLAREDQLDAAHGISHHGARVNGVRLHYAACGQSGRPLLLFVHGFPEFWFEWEGLLREFGRDHYAVAPDLRGFNLSDKPAAVAAYRANEVIEDLRQLIGALGYRRSVMVAHDWGGALAWNFASRHPDLLDGLVAINAAHTALFVRALAQDAAQQAASRYMLFYRSQQAEALLSADGYARMCASLRDTSSDPAWFDAATQARYVEAWSQSGALTGGLNYYRASPVFPASADAPGAAALQLRDEDFLVRVPTLVLWGERDHALLPCLLDGLDGFVPDLEIHRVPEASHWIVHEQPARLIGVMRDWLARRLARQRAV
jgi:pimeloyl-ACP methyl ester carboxylesterase